MYIKVGGDIYNKLRAAHSDYFKTAQRRVNSGVYVGQKSPFCGPISSPKTYPVRNPAEYQDVIKYAANADQKDQVHIRACAERVRASGFKSGGN